MNKQLIAVLCFCAAATCASAATGDGTATTSTKTTVPAKAPPAVTIPKGAVHNADGTWIWKDKKGAKWVYSETPFGVRKKAWSEPKPELQSGPTTKAVEEGDMVKFERPSPFGSVKWEKKKSDLTDEERQILDRQNASPANTKPVPGIAKSE